MIQRVVPGLSGSQRFVGYYDHNPFKPDDEALLLVHATHQPAWWHPSPHRPVSIQLLDWRKGIVAQELGQSFAWNWQQGARALWVNSNTVVFNIYDPDSDCYRARLVNADGALVMDLPIPVQEVDRLGRIYGFSYEALAEIRPDYGYRNRPAGARSFMDNAIEQYDLVTGSHRVLADMGTLSADAQARHGRPISRPKLNHLMVAADARRAVFLFRYFVDGERVTDLYRLDVEEGKAHLVVGDAGVSHVCWWDDGTVLATMMGSSGFGYYLVSVDEGTYELAWLQGDGHPSRLNNSHVLTDTYPDRYGLRHLLIGTLGENTFEPVASFPEPLLFQGETRCDLHPSLSPSGRWIQVDCAVGHRRTVAVLPNPLFSEGACA